MNNFIGGNPLLGSLGAYGGPTLTLPLLPNSPAIGGGTANDAPLVDQRGQPRIGHVDIGAFQSGGFTLTPAPNSNGQSTPINQPFRYPLAVAVAANNPLEPVNGGVVFYIVTPVGDASATLSSAAATIANGQASVTATANGTRGTHLVSAAAAGAASSGIALTNTEARSLTVTTRSDVVDATDGLTSLREAIAYANSHVGPDTIVLDPTVFGTKSRTIRLTGGPLILTDPATTIIIGPGAKRLTISGGGKSRVFDIQGGSVAISALTISGGRADLGGGLRNEGGSLTLTKVAIRGNRALIGRGLFKNGSASLTDVVIRGNKAPVGSGLFKTRRATLSWRWSPARLHTVSDSARHPGRNEALI